jgi:hypothetical protein
MSTLNSADFSALIARLSGQKTEDFTVTADRNEYNYSLRKGYKEIAFCDEWNPACWLLKKNP